MNASRSFEWIDFPGASEQIPLIAPPVSLSRTPAELRQRAPLTGEHTDEVLLGLGYGSDAIAALHKSGVV